MSESNEPIGAPEPGPDATPAPSGRSRQSLGLWIGIGLGIVVVVAVLGVTLLAGGDSSDEDAATPTLPVPENVPSTTLPKFIIDALSNPAPVPPGDYGPMCEVMLENDPIEGNLTPAQMAKLVRQTDFAALVPLAPEGLRPALELLRDSRDDVVGVLESVDSFAELEQADFPQGFFQAASLVTRAGTEKCLTGG